MKQREVIATTFQIAHVDAANPTADGDSLAILYAEGSVSKKLRIVKSEVSVTGVKTEAGGGDENGSEAVEVHLQTRIRRGGGERAKVTAASKPGRMRRQQAAEGL